MKITNLRLADVSIPLKRPFKTALRTVNAVQDIVVCIETDEGVCGYGEAAPTAVITGDTTGSIREAILVYLAPVLLGRDIDDFENLLAAVSGAMVKNTSAKAAVDIALHDLFAKSCQKPLYKLLGGAKPVIETDITISVNPVEQMVADSLSAVAGGYNILKVKVGKEGFADVARMEAIRRAVGPETVLRVDANQGWEAKQAVRIIRAMEDRGLEIELVEQPVPAHNLAGMRYITQNVSTAILADESVFSAADAVEIIRAGAADLINIKLMKTGGIHEALRICAIAESFGVGCMVGCMLESHISVGAAAHLAAARRVCTMADLDGPSLCAENPYTGGPEYNGPNIVLSNQPGIGVVQVPGFENKG